jgi:hypothetical protein
VDFSYLPQIIHNQYSKRLNRGHLEKKEMEVDSRYDPLGEEREGSALQRP